MDRPASSATTRASSSGEHGRVAGRVTGELGRVAGRVTGELGRDTGQLARQDDPTILDEFSFSLIGKILNPKKQNIEKLLQKMPSHWGLADRITANDLGNGKFLFSFTTEEDLQSVLCQGPFHFNFCSRLGHVDKVEHTEGRMLIAVDTRRPLKFTRKADSPEGDEEVKNRLQPQTERQDVFARVQVPSDQRYKPSRSSRNDPSDRKIDEGSNYRRSHSDRIMHRREEQSRNNRYGGSRVGTGPYDRKPALTWRQKPLGEQKGNRVELATNSGDIVPYEHSAVSRSDGKQSTEVMRSPKITVTRRLASTIITPSRADLPMEENVTKGVKEATRSLSFYVLSDHELQDGVGDGQIIGAFSDMEIADQHDGEMMDYDVGNDDLLGLELTEMGSGSRQDSLKEAGRSADKATRSRRQSAKTNVSLGIPSRKFEILRWGSPRKRSTSSHVDAGKSRHQHQRDTKLNY
ncbi:hypothetical protein DY000_02016192 [Brassica cretica]|uniref:DUF4283 domain-containing protein n=1 Tax=Brassica cretica TaxID=69181 RepID=A0ABQ7D164_BRACR|nr:hypothetical protein DY000_02016192 [Brassica cretica]